MERLRESLALVVGNDMLTMAKDQRGITRKIFSVLDSANADELLLEPLTRLEP